MVAFADKAPLQSERASVPTGFDVFVLLLTILSLINTLLTAVLARRDIVNVVLIVDGILCLIFLGDFLLRLRRAPSKRGYFIGDLSWLDLLGSLPVPGLRLARIPRVLRVGRAVRRSGLHRLGRSAAADRAGNSLLAAILLTIVVLQYGSMAILRAEDEAEGSNFHTASDASYVTITSVGYGDRYPVTNLGRNIGVAMLTIGIGLFGVLTAFIANLFLNPRRARHQASADPAADLRRDLDELRHLIAELRAQLPDAASGGTDSTRLDAAASTPSQPRRLDHGRS